MIKNILGRDFVFRVDFLLSHNSWYFIVIYFVVNHKWCKFQKKKSNLIFTENVLSKDCYKNLNFFTCCTNNQPSIICITKASTVWHFYTFRHWVWLESSEYKRLCLWSFKNYVKKERSQGTKKIMELNILLSRPRSRDRRGLKINEKNERHQWISSSKIELWKLIFRNK